MNTVDYEIEKTRYNWYNEGRLVLPGKKEKARRSGAVYFDIKDTVNLAIDESKDSELIECYDEDIIVCEHFKQGDNYFIVVKRLADGKILLEQEVVGPLSGYAKLKVLSVFVGIRLLILPAHIPGFMRSFATMNIDLPSIIWDAEKNNLRFLVYCRGVQKNLMGRSSFSDMYDYSSLETDEEKRAFMYKTAIEEFKFDRLQAYIRKRKELKSEDSGGIYV